MTNPTNPTLQQLLAEKLRPHADRVVAGKHNEFDYLPAALHHAAERDNQSALSLEAMATNLAQNDAGTKQRLEEQSAQTREHLTLLIHKLQANQKASLESMATDLKQSDASTQQRVSELALKTREHLAILLKTLQSDQENQVERYVQLNRLTNMLLCSCVGIAVVTLALTAIMFFKR